MIKYYCDICQKQIEDLNYQGRFQIKQKHIAFLKHNKEDQVRVLGYLLCVSCAEKILSKINELKDERKNIGNTE
jgi:hypothetical protein